MTKNSQALHDLISHAKQDANCVTLAYKIISNAPKLEQAKLFEQFVLEFKYTHTDHTMSTHDVFFGEENEVCSIKARIALHDLLEQIEVDAKDSDEYNSMLWDAVSDKKRNFDPKDRYQLLFACGINKRVPFVDHKKAFTLTKEEFDSAIKKVNPVLRAKVMHIKNQRFKQVTEDAGYLMKILEEEKDLEKKALLLSLFLFQLQLE